MDSTLKTKLNAIQPKALKPGAVTVTDQAHYMDPAEYNTLIDAVKANNIDAEAAQTAANNAQSAADAANTAAGNAQTAATIAQSAAIAAQGDVTALEGRVSTLESSPATVEVFLTTSSGNLTVQNAATYKMAVVNDGINPVEIWVSNGVDNWTQFAGGSGGFNYSPKINGFGLKPNSVSDTGWTIQVTSISDNEADIVNGQILVDSGVYQTIASITLGVPLEWVVSGQSTGTHSCILKIYDEAHPGGITATVTVKLVSPTSTLTTTATKSQMVVNGTPDIATQATITKIRVAYQLQGTDANADAAVTAGRYFDLTSGADITAFQGAGYTKALTLTPGATYIPSVQVTANTGTGIVQTGGWTAGSSVLIDPAPTQPVISATVNTSGNVTVNLTTASTDATPETPTYDIAVWDSVGNAWLVKQTGIAGNSPYLTGTALGTTYADGTTLQVKVTAKDSHNNAMDSNIVNLTVSIYTYQTAFNGASGTAPDTGYFTVMNTSGGTAALDGNGNLLVKTPNGSTDGSMVYRTQAVTLQSNKTYKVKFKGNTDAPTYASGCALGVIHASSKTAPTVDTTISPITYFNVYYGGTALSFIYKNSGGTYTRWNGSAWAGSGNITGLTLGTTYVVKLETSTTSGFRFTLLSADESTVISQTTWVAWSNLASVTTSTWLFFGDQQSDYYSTNLSFDTFTEI